MVLITGLLFFASAAIENLIGLALEEDTPGFKIFSSLMNAIIVLIWFAILYKFLPFVTIQWKSVWRGAAITTLLFFLGIRLLDLYVVEEGNLEDLHD
jgi:membrane protein